jgi:hypothetical protein
VNNIVDLLCEAKNLKKCVNLHYGGHNRTVEVHAVGRNKSGNTLLRCFQVSGSSHSGQPKAWKLMDVSKISSCSIADLDSNAPRPKYNASDKEMTAGIICCV